MRIYAFLLAAIFGVTCFAGATTQPTGQTPQIAVFSFENVGPKDQAWVARAIEENFIAELSRAGTVWPVRAIAKSADQNDVMMTARNSGATYVLTGSYQIVDEEIRATGQIIAVDDGHVVGGLTATGPTRDLFGIEDTLAMQAKRMVAPQHTGSAEAVQPIAPYGPAVQPNVPTVNNDFNPATYQPGYAYGYQPQYNQYYYYSMPYGYTDYGYGYGFGYPIVIGGGCFGAGFHGGGFHNGFHGGFAGGGVHGHISWGGSGVGMHSARW